MNPFNSLLIRISLMASMLSFVSAARGQDLADMFINWDPSWPQRFGITGIGYSQEQNYELDNFSVDIPLEVDPGALLTGIENEVSQWGVKADAWVLPFWNVHAMVGKVDGQTAVNLSLGAQALLGYERIAVDYEGTVLAGGSTLAYGQDWWFVSLTGVYAYTDVKGDIESIRSWLIMPRVGARRGKLEAWVGATYQNVAERQSGVFDLDGLVLNYDLELKAEEAWNAQLGLRYSLTDSLFVTLEAGFGNRESITGLLEWRF
ncbi:MAG: hypothetical protein NZ804_11725 [Roseibacillus sp.]|nr:hypothetical protein [Roseibacillus sp.]